MCGFCWHVYMYKDRRLTFLHGGLQFRELLVDKLRSQPSHVKPGGSSVSHRYGTWRHGTTGWVAVCSRSEKRWIQQLPLDLKWMNLTICCTSKCRFHELISRIATIVHNSHLINMRKKRAACETACDIAKRWC